MPAISEQNSLLESFLLSQSTIICLGIRIALLLNQVPRDVQQWLSHPSFQSLFTRPTFVYSALDMESLFVENGLQQQQSKWSTLLLPWLLLTADLLTAYTLVYVGTTLRKKQDQDEEEKILQVMPDAIRPKYKVFCQTETDDEEVYLMPRRHLPHLSGSIYLWGTLFASSTGVAMYGGILSSLTNAVCVPFMASPASGDALVPIFLIPLYLTMSQTKRFESKKQPLLISFGLMALYYYYVTFSTAQFEIPTYSTPNLGVQWYFSQQMFDRFRAYFGIMFFGIRFSLVIPLGMQFGSTDGSISSYVMELTTCYWFIYTIFQMYHPTVTDFLIGLALMLHSPRSLARMSVIPSLVVLCAIPVPLILYCLDWQMWLETGTGNANFIYFQCLAYHAFIIILFVEFCGATVRRQTALHLTKNYDDRKLVNDVPDPTDNASDGAK